MISNHQQNLISLQKPKNGETPYIFANPQVKLISLSFFCALFFFSIRIDITIQNFFNNARIGHVFMQNQCSKCTQQKSCQRNTGFYYRLFSSRFKMLFKFSCVIVRSYCLCCKWRHYEKNVAPPCESDPM